jgi:hypothetical protein
MEPLIALARQSHVEFRFQKVFDEAAYACAHRSFDGNINIAGSTINGSIVDSGTDPGFELRHSDRQRQQDHFDQYRHRHHRPDIYGRHFQRRHDFGRPRQWHRHRRPRTRTTVTTFSGGISNAGTISAGGVGIIVQDVIAFSGGISNSGTIIGSIAAIDVSNATSPVTIDQTGGLISGAIKLSANADVLNVSGGTINGSITSLGTSTLNQSGGLVLLSGTNSIGTATLTGGTLEIGDALHTSTTLTLTNATTLDVTGGTLEGHGTLIGNATIGTLTIKGNLTFNAGSTYAVSLSPTQSSLTNVSGNVTINGGNVVLAPQAGFFGRIAILTSTSTLTGTFNPTVTFAGSVRLIVAVRRRPQAAHAG